MAYSDFAVNTRQQSWEQEGEVLQTIQEVIDLHFALFRYAGKLEYTEKNELQRVWFGLSTSAFHSLRVALYALESGYYSQCFTLTRAALEDWLVAFDCKSHPQTVEALLGSGGRVPAFRVMAERLPEDRKVLWRNGGDGDGAYGSLSTFAHPRQRALEATVGGDGTALIFPAYNEIRFALAAKLLLQVALLMLEFVERLADYLTTPASQEWKSRNLKEVEPKGFALLKSLVYRSNSYVN